MYDTTATQTETQSPNLAQPGDTYTNGERVVHVNATDLTNGDVAQEIPDDAVLAETVTVPVERYASLSAAGERLVDAFDVDLPVAAFQRFDTLLVRDPEQESVRTYHEASRLDHFILDDEWVLLAESNVLEQRIAYGIVSDEPRLQPDD